MATTLTGARFESFSRILHQITVEPIVFLIFLAFSSLAVSEHTLLYEIVCVQNFGESGVECNDLRNDPILEDRVQKIASTWTIFLSLSYVLPAILAENFLGAFSDLYGRKFNILLGFAGLILTTVPDFLYLAYPLTPLYILVVSNILAGFTGYAASIMISCMAFLADTIRDERSLTFRMTILSICKSSGALCGAFATGALTKFVSLGTTILLSQSVLVVAFFYTLWRIPNDMPEKGRRKQRDESAPGSKPDVIPNMATAKAESRINGVAVMESCRRVIKMNKEVVKTLIKRRPYHRRAYLLLCTVSFFCYTMSELGLQHGPLMSLYVFRRPFNWSPSDLGVYKGVQHAFASAGSVLGAILIRKYQKSKFEVTSVILLALASGFGFLLLTGLAESSYVLYIASAVGSFATLLVPAMKSFVTHQVEPDEIGKALAVNGIAADVAFVLTTLVFTNIYNATLTAFAGLVFVLGAIVVAGCFCAVVWMHFDIARQKRRIEHSREVCSAVATTHTLSPMTEETKCFT